MAKPKNIEIKPEIDLETIQTKNEAEKALEKLRQSINYHDYRYYVLNDPVITDSEYDLLFDQLNQLENKFPDLITPTSPTQRVSGQASDALDKVDHPQPMYSLQSVRKESEVTNFYNNVLEGLDKKEVNFVAEPKYDGLAIELIYENGKLVQASTRGDGQTGEEITENIKTIKEVPLKLISISEKKPPQQLIVRGEVYMEKDEFEKFNQDRIEAGKDAFANPRNAAAGSVRQLDPKITSRRPLHIYFYEVSLANDLGFKTHLEALKQIHQWGMKVNLDQTKLCQHLEELFDYHHDLSEKRNNLNYEIDGVVYKVNNLGDQKKLGTRTRNPRWALAYKFEPKSGTTTIKDVNWQVGRTGKLTPVANLKPIKVGGVTIKHASLHNPNEINKKDIRIGDTVIVERAGDVIPYVVKPIKDRRKSEEKEIQLPENCPVCQSNVILSENKKNIHCPNVNCPAQLKQSLTHFASRQAMKIEGLGKEVANQLVNAGIVENLADIYRLDKKTLQSLERFAKKSAENLISEIESSKKDQPLHRFLFGLGIPEVGEHAAQILAENYTNINHLKNSNQQELEQIHQIGPEIAKNIVEYFNDQQNLKMINEMIDQGLKLTNPLAEKKLSPLKDKKIVFTGSLESMTRNEAKDLVINQGGQVSSSVSSQTDFLVIGENPGSKLEKAKELGVEIINENKFRQITS